ncbi:MAG: hypothetical protein JWN45_3017 [Acidobacteriaceae bacterium]|nr:hypothetical protein [Acidobacteriaceae bacterium]
MQRRLRIESAQADSVINEYRITRGEVELRTLRPEFPRREWRQMNEDELQLHENLNTAVALWIQSEDVMESQ